jgi:hypothetical protein
MAFMFTLNIVAIVDVVPDQFVEVAHAHVPAVAEDGFVDDRILEENLAGLRLRSKYLLIEPEHILRLGSHCLEWSRGVGGEHKYFSPQND